MTETVTAAILVIGDEILSGRTKDKNIGYIAEYMTNIGVDVREVRVVPDVEEEIVSTLNHLRNRYTYVFTTGGIGPTHDDITADCVAKAFGVSIDVDPRARALLLTRIAEKDLNEARLRMARIPAGADLILNKVSAAPGFRIGTISVSPKTRAVAWGDFWTCCSKRSGRVVSSIGCWVWLKASMTVVRSTSAVRGIARRG